LGFGEELEVVWVPDSSKPVSGEVKNKIVYIYETVEDEAVRVLRHEVLDYLLSSKIINPLVSLINLLIKSRG